jgi:hypothetical protein
LTWRCCGITKKPSIHKLCDETYLKETTTEELSQYLKVEVRTAPCRLRRYKRDGKGKIAIAMSLGNGWDAIAEVFWGLPPDRMNETALKGILLPGAEFRKSSVNSLYARVLTLEQDGQYYQCIGITRLPARFGERTTFRLSANIPKGYFLGDETQPANPGKRNPIHCNGEIQVVEIS